MDEKTYATIPETLELRELRYATVEKGKRTKSITVVTTLTDVTAHTNESAIAVTMASVNLNPLRAGLAATPHRSLPTLAFLRRKRKNARVGREIPPIAASPPSTSPTARGRRGRKSRGQK